MPDFIYSVEDFINPATLPGAIVFALVFLLLAFLGGRVVHLLVRRSMKRWSWGPRKPLPLCPPAGPRFF